MEIGEITITDIILLLVGLIVPSYIVYKLVLKNKNTLKNNKSGGSIVGGDDIESETIASSTKIKNQNTLIGNEATGDIIGGSRIKAQKNDE